MEYNMKISVALAKKFEQALIRLSSSFDMDVRPNYSGRGMFGKTCLGIDTDHSAFAVAVNVVNAIHDMQDIDENERELLLEAVEGTRQDNTGLGYIYYWHGISYDEPQTP